jgi:nickel-dependent lactate racemase
MVRPRDRVTIIVSDTTRREPRADFLAALRTRITDVRWTLAIATGTHGPVGRDALAQLGLPRELAGDMTVVDHDGHDDRDLVDLGVTALGTPVRLHRCAVEADLVIATGCIKPHYFAGFGAGVKAIYPGLGAAAAIRINHRLKTAAGARAGIVEGNPCRADLEAAVALLATPTFLLDGVLGPDERVHAAVAGDPVRAFRAGAELARPWFTVRAPSASLVIASDDLPMTASLYQAAKLAAAAAPLVAPGGTLVLVAECFEGIEPLAVVNEAVFRIGVLPRLAPGVTLGLISALPRDQVSRTLLQPLDSIVSLLASHPMPLVIPNASELICEASS